MLNILRRIVQEVAEARSFSDALNLIVREVKDAMGTEVCSVYLLTPEERLLFIANEGLNPSAIGKLSLATSEGLVGLVCERAEPINLEDATSHPRFHYMPEIGEEAFHAFLGVPVVHHRKPMGVLVVQQRERRRFDEGEEAFLVTLAAQIATIIAHAEATGDLRAVVTGDEVHADVHYKGVAGAPGVAIGTVVALSPAADLDSVPERATDDVTTELLTFDKAVDAARAEIAAIGEQFNDRLPPEELALFDAYLHMLDDNAIPGDVRDLIREGNWAQGALKRVIRDHLRAFEQMNDPYLRERGADVKDLGLRLLAHLQNIRTNKVTFPADTVLVGDDISPGLLAMVPPENLRAVVSRRGSGTSHVAILARALGIPAVMGAVDVSVFALEHTTAIVDGFYGEVIANPSRRIENQYRKLIEDEAQFTRELDPLKELPSVTQDGWRVRLWVNIGLTGDISRSLDRGAEGIGLFRTEIPFMTQDRFPTEEEQRLIYREHMEAFEPRPVTMRTLDVGGDKDLSYFPIREDNPFLGWRGIRVTLDHPEIFLVQVRAMIKANAGLEGVLRIMLPMISSITEVEEAQELVAQAYQEVIEEGFEVKRPHVGVMVEVPAAVYQARTLARKVDFLSVGSNDLTQYMLAVDRNNPRVADLYQDVHPAVLGALREVARAAHAEETPIGICGELAGTPIGAVLLMAMGYHVLSMNATNLPKIKWVIRNIKRSDARRMLARCLRMNTAGEIRHYMREQLTAAGLGRAMPSHND